MRMRLSALFIFTTLVIATVHAQKIVGGIKAGTNVSNQRYDSDLAQLSPDVKMSIHAGFFAVVDLGSFGIQPELLYSRLGADFDGTPNKYNYLSLPVMIRYNVTNVFNVQAGPNFGLLLSAKDPAGRDVKDRTKSLDLALGVGLGFDFLDKFIVTARHNIGLANIVDIDGLGAKHKVKNNVFQLSLGYKMFSD
jgi:hypothetical protein